MEKTVSYDESESFVKKCFAEGLNEEQTSALLDQHLVTELGVQEERGA